MPHTKIYLSGTTMEIIETNVRGAILTFAKEYEIDENLIRAIIRQESNWNLCAIRFEPHLVKAKWYYRHLTQEERLDPFYFCSFGLMQVLFAVARSHGFKGTPFELLHPKNAIAYGALHLKKLLGKYKTMSDAVSAYNQGSPRKHTDGPSRGMYLNQHYVEKILHHKKKLEEGDNG